MKTILDGTPSWLWFPESAEYKDHELSLILVEGAVAEKEVRVDIISGIAFDGLKPLEVLAGARRVEVHFEDVKALHVLDEVAHLAQPGERRESGVVAKHHGSALLRWHEGSTKLIDITPGELFHYSVQTAEDFYHVLTRVHPTVGPA